MPKSSLFTNRLFLIAFFFFWLSLCIVISSWFRSSVYAQGINSTSLSLSPSSPSVSAGQDLSIDLLVDSQNEPINVVQAVLLYPQDQLDYLSFNTQGSLFTITAKKEIKNGLAILAVGAIKPVTGSNLVGKIIFKAKKNTPSSVIKLTDKSEVISATTHNNLLVNLNSSTYSSLDYSTPKPSPNSFNKTISNTTLNWWEKMINYFKSLFKR